MGQMEIKMPRVDQNGHPTFGSEHTDFDTEDKEKLKEASERTKDMLNIGDRAMALGAIRRRVL